MRSGDTIAAVSSAPPQAYRVVVRVSGPGALGAARGLADRALPAAGAVRCRLRLPGLAGATFPGTVYLFAGPRSYTGEDVAELHVPGSPWLVGELMRHLVSLDGVRQAEAGEFTARAFFNGKLDLSAAEGVAAAISAADARQLRAAQQLLAGTLAGRVRGLADRLSTLLALLEAGIDFSEEEVSFVSAGELRAGLADLRGEVEGILAEGARFGAVSGEPAVVLVGRPNAGKSTLMNALLGRERAVTSPVAGTTRDVLYDVLELPRGRVRLTDVAGVGDEVAVEGGVLGQIERDMRARALAAVGGADVVVRVREVGDVRPDPVLPREADLTVRTKADLRPGAGAGEGEVIVSAVGGVGLDELRGRLDRLCFGGEGGDGLALTTRHVGHLRAARDGLAAAGEAVGRGDELVAAAMRGALDGLGAITGEVSPDDVLGKVFATFCIGK